MKNHEDQLKKAKEMGVEMPRYIKPGSVNPLSYASQMQKRKQLWAKPAASGLVGDSAPHQNTYRILKYLHLQNS